MKLKELLDLFEYKTDINLFFEHCCTGIIDSNSYLANANADHEVTWIDVDKNLVNIGLCGEEEI